MGACLTLERDELAARRRSDEIDKQLDAMAKERPRILKILLLGAGESGLYRKFLYNNPDSYKTFSGKSTLVKQMKIIHTDGFSISELSAFRPTVLDNLLASMKYVLTGMGLLRINLEHQSNKRYAEAVLSSPSCFDMEFKIVDSVRSALKVLWKDRGVRMAVVRGYDYELNDSAL